MVSITTAGKVNIKAWQDNNLIAFWVGDTEGKYWQDRAT